MQHKNIVCNSSDTEQQRVRCTIAALPSAVQHSIVTSLSVGLVFREWSLQNMSKLHEINLPKSYPTNTCATTYCTKLVLEIDVTIDSYLTTFLEKLTVLYCKNVVPQYVLTFIYFSPVLCFTLVYNCSLRVRNKQICYVMLPVAMVGQSSGSTA